MDGLLEIAVIFVGFCSEFLQKHAKGTKDRGAFLPRFSGRFHLRPMYRRAGKVSDSSALAPLRALRASVNKIPSVYFSFANVFHVHLRFKSLFGLEF